MNSTATTHTGITKAAGKAWRKKAKKSKRPIIEGEEFSEDFLDDPFTSEEDEPEPEPVLTVKKRMSFKDRIGKEKENPTMPKGVGRKSRTLKPDTVLEMPPIGDKKAPVDFLAMHSILPPEKVAQYQTLFSQIDVDNSNSLDPGELTNALKVLNEHLISDKEIEYTMRILEMMDKCGIAAKDPVTGEMAITFEQFSVMAALSEKITALDKATKGVINDMDFEAMEKKMLKAKDLFFLNDDDGDGEIDLDTVYGARFFGWMFCMHSEECFRIARLLGLKSGHMCDLTSCFFARARVCACARDSSSLSYRCLP
jgi:Ca2+-binding EF-hand superfamily protein